MTPSGATQTLNPIEHGPILSPTASGSLSPSASSSSSSSSGSRAPQSASSSLSPSASSSSSSSGSRAPQSASSSLVPSSSLSITLPSFNPSQRFSSLPTIFSSSFYPTPSSSRLITEPPVTNIVLSYYSVYAANASYNSIQSSLNESKKEFSSSILYVLLFFNNISVINLDIFLKNSNNYNDILKKNDKSSDLISIKFSIHMQSTEPSPSIESSTFDITSTLFRSISDGTLENCLRNQDCYGKSNFNSLSEEEEEPEPQNVWSWVVICNPEDLESVDKCIKIAEKQNEMVKICEYDVSLWNDIYESQG